jgi:hypothetical protein
VDESDPDGVAKAEAENIVFVPDRPFNDVHYHLDSRKLGLLGWREEMSWEEGIRRTVEWYRVNSGNWGDLTSALVAHPRRGLTAAEMGAQLEALGKEKALEKKALEDKSNGALSPSVRLSRRPAHA